MCLRCSLAHWGSVERTALACVHSHVLVLALHCQDQFSQLEADANRGAKMVGKHVGYGNYCSRVIGADARQVALVIGKVMAIT